MPAVNATDSTAKESQKESVGDPWFEKGDELNRLSGDERRALAEKNETVKKMIEEDLKVKPVKIENSKDLENLPANYPEDINKVITETISSKITDQKSSTLQATTTNTVNVWIVADEEHRSTFGSNW
ncbi:MAG: hypothetical protein NHB15_12585 [Methanosarcina barkeri]|nr:hypothetical protein [Methanosarcina sp. ERenArc_MAG2]